MSNKLWLVTQDINNDYDTYDSIVVCAPDEETARNTHPRDTHYERETWDMSPKAYPTYEEFIRHEWGDEYSGWVNDPKYVKVTYLGIADDSVKLGVVLASYNAG